MTAAADYGSTRIVRGGTAVAAVGGEKSTLTTAVKCTGRAQAQVSFAASGTVSVGAASIDTGAVYPFNVEGYQYV